MMKLYYDLTHLSKCVSLTKTISQNSKWLPSDYSTMHPLILSHICAVQHTYTHQDLYNHHIKEEREITLTAPPFPDFLTTALV